MFTAAQDTLTAPLGKSIKHENVGPGLQSSRTEDKWEGHCQNARMYGFDLREELWRRAIESSNNQTPLRRRGWTLLLTPSVFTGR